MVPCRRRESIGQRRGRKLPIFPLGAPSAAALSWRRNFLNTDTCRRLSLSPLSPVPVAPVSVPISPSLSFYPFLSVPPTLTTRAASDSRDSLRFVQRVAPSRYSLCIRRFCARATGRIEFHARFALLAARTRSPSTGSWTQNPRRCGSGHGCSRSTRVA